MSRDTLLFEEYGRMWEHVVGMPFMAMDVGCMKDYMDYTPRILDEIMSAWQNKRILRQVLTIICIYDIFFIDSDDFYFSLLLYRAYRNLYI